MNTAKNLQLLDAQSNNISPATNIESIYYEINQGGTVYRNAIYKHFPVYVRYNNNSDNAYTVGTNSVVAQMANGVLSMENYNSSLGKVQNNGTDILVSSIEQKQLSGTRYYKLDVRTYNLTNILQQFAGKYWTAEYLKMHDVSIHNIWYESELPLSIDKSVYGVMRTSYDVGGLESGQVFNNLNKKTLNSILDEILFPNVMPTVSDIQLTMEPTSVIGMYLNSNNNAIHFMRTDTYADVSINVCHSGGEVRSVFRDSTGNLEEVDKTCEFKQSNTVQTFTGLGDYTACEVETIKLSSDQLGGLHTSRGKTSLNAVSILEDTTIRTVDSTGSYDSARVYNSANTSSSCEMDSSLYYNISMCIPVLGYIGETNSMTFLAVSAYCQNYIDQQTYPTDLSWDYIDKLGIHTCEFWYAATRPMYFFMYVPYNKNVPGGDLSFSTPYVSWINSGMGWSQCHYELALVTTHANVQMYYNVADADKKGTLKSGCDGNKAAFFNVYTLPSTRGDLTDYYSDSLTAYANADKPYMKIRVTFNVVKTI